MDADTPRVLVNTRRLEPTVTAGAAWKLQESRRDLDSNVIVLPPGGGIDAHDGPPLDVLVHVLAGSGELGTDGEPVALEPGALVWLPRGSRRQFTAGPEGLRYLTVHQRRQALTLEPFSG
ncbi:cupin domain-containing protein [Sporichthya polymorpha]|uniref:cupin domain-containing protein n=1 Tax=Sporichthya polymorpha TaxID=35751 RepID=UPI00037D95C2|nr:cupin domain-containing protein [Sporichthya polymorpha]